MLVTLKEVLKVAEEKEIAIGAFNAPNLESLQAVMAAAEEMDLPVIIQFAPVHEVHNPLALMGPLMVDFAKKAKVPVCVHLDHGSDYEFVMRAVKIGFPSIMYDCSALPFEENLEKVKKFVQFAHAAGITVEAELGVMASTEEDTHGEDAESRVLTNEDIKEFFTEPEEAKVFAEETGCDALAVCFGTMHGIYAEPPVLDIDRVKALRAAIPDTCRVVMHGASGVEFDQVKNAISAGCSKINYYSYMAKAATKFVADKVAETEGKIAYHELQEAAYEFMKGYAKDVISAFKNGK